MSATAIYSPGYQLPLFLGPAQLRLWRRLDRLIGGRTFAATTVRALAGELGANPGTVSRDLDALQRLGLAVHESAWGRAGVRLWRVVSRGGRRGLDPSRQRRAWARMGVRVVAGQLGLALSEGLDAAGTRDHDPTGAADPPTVAPVNHGDRLHDGTPDGSAPGVEPSGPFSYAHCACGRPRIVMVGKPAPDCTHG